MKAPDKIYISPMPNPADGYVGIAWADAHRDMVEYIRKDSLLEWARTEQKKYREDTQFDMGYLRAVNDLIKKLESL